MARGIDFLNEILSQHPTLGRKRKGGSDSGASRSALLKIIMPEISGGMGDTLAQLADKGDVEGFANKWADVTRRILTKVEEAGNKNDKKLKEKVDASVKRRLLIKSNNEANLVQLRQQLIQLKRQHKASPSDSLMKRLTALKERIEKIEKTRIMPVQEETFEYEKEKRLKREQNG